MYAKLLILPAIIVVFAIFPLPIVHMLIYAELAIPFRAWLGSPPFYYEDKTWLITPLGVFVVGLLWAVITYLVSILIYWCVILFEKIR